MGRLTPERREVQCALDVSDALKKSPACLTGLCDSGNRQGELAVALFER